MVKNIVFIYVIIFSLFAFSKVTSGNIIIADTITDIEFATQRINDELAEKVAEYLTTDFLKDDLPIMEKSERKFQMYQVDLNGDGNKELFVRFFTSYFCGTGGCTILLLDKNMKPITIFTVTRPPIFVEKTKVNNWAILLVKDSGVFKELIYKNGSYPSNPSVLPRAPYDAPSGHAEVLFDENYSKAKTYEF